MGAIKTSKLDNGNIGLEITYGGKDAPFGGIDNSAPPQYIAPNCFTDSNNFIVVNEQIQGSCWYPTTIALQDWGADIYLDSGRFYSIGKYWNWALGYNSVTGPSSTTITYDIWVWPASATGAIAKTASLPVEQSLQYSVAVGATAEIVVFPGYNIPYPSFTYVDVNIVVSGVTSTCTTLYSSPPAPTLPHTPAQLAAKMVSDINGTAGFPVTAALLSDGLTIELTATAVGVATNAYSVNISYSNAYEGIGINHQFAGGSDSIAENFAIPLDPLSWTTLGEDLILGGAGTCILRFSFDPTIPLFGVLTQYLGAISINKYAGHLIAGGVVPGPGQVIKDSEMIVAWSAANAPSIWNPENADGTVTGAGFAEEADLSDYITALFISNSVLVILHTQGIDYATALQSSASPFDFNHVSNALFGEGCQDGRLATQYDQVGCFIGNSDVYVFANSLEPIGTRIKVGLLPEVFTSPPINRDSTSGSYAFSVDHTFAFFVIDYKLYHYCFNNKTWMISRLANYSNERIFITNWVQWAFNPNGPQFNNYAKVILASQVGTSVPTFWQYIPTVQNADFTYATASWVLFPQEEIDFGRDITIDSLLVSVKGTPGQVVNFSVSGILHGSLTVPSNSDYTEVPVYWTEDVTTIKRPQLRLDVPISASGIFNQLSFSKIAMFGSFDPNQRPV